MHEGRQRNSQSFGEGKRKQSLQSGAEGRMVGAKPASEQERKKWEEEGERQGEEKT